MTETDRYLVVVNEERQYSVWLAGKELPSGWHAEGTVGNRADCLDHIDQVWTDIRPYSVRMRMGSAQTPPG